MSGGRRYRRRIDRRTVEQHIAHATRQYRRRIDRRTVEQHIAHATRQPAIFAGEIDAHHEAWSRGRVLFIVPKIPDAAPGPIKRALERRRRASLTGRCDCGAQRARAGHDGPIASQDFDHADDCPASDAGLRELCIEHSWFGGAA